MGAYGENRRVCYLEQPSGQDMMSGTNVISYGSPFWLKDPDLSSPAQAFTATGQLV